MSKRLHDGRQPPMTRETCIRESVEAADSRDVPNCASGPAYRFSWTVREIINILRRRT